MCFKHILMKKKIKILIKNKYFWMSIMFLIWISFFDTNSLLLHYKFSKDIDNMTKSKEYLKKKYI